MGDPIEPESRTTDRRGRTPRTWAITGSSSGIGAALRELVLADGDRVIGIDLEGAPIRADLGRADGRASAIAQVEDAVGDGSLDVVVTCAGLASASAVTVPVNYFGTIRVLDGLQPLLQRSPAPRAVALGSVAGTYDVDRELVERCDTDDEDAVTARVDELLRSGEGRTIYASSKLALARWVRREAPLERWAGSGIALNAVAPGIVQTPMMARSLADPGKRSSLEAQIPMPLTKGPCDPVDIAHVVRALASPDNRVVTGQIVYADGGTEVLRRGRNVT